LVNRHANPLDKHEDIEDYELGYDHDHGGEAAKDILSV